MLSAGSVPNYGLVPPAGTLVIDVDGDDLARLPELEERLGALPQTFTTETPHGRHLYFRGQGSGNLLGLVTRWPDTGYVVGPWSAIGAKQYRGVPAPIADLPGPWLVAAAQERRPVPIVGSDEKVGGGHRHEYLRNRAYALRRNGLTGELLFQAVMALNELHCDPPKSETDVRRAIGEVDRFGTEPYVPPMVESMPRWQNVYDLREEDAELRLDPILPAAGGFAIEFGDGGQGKTSFGVSAMVQIATGLDVTGLGLVGDPAPAGILDFEGHPGAVRRLVSGLHPERTDRIGYLLCPRPLWEMQEDVIAMLRDLDASALFIDSVGYAIGNLKLVDPEAPIAFQRALADIEQAIGTGLSTLASAHVRGTDGAAKPFGSVFWHNAARMTWYVERSNGTEDDEEATVSLVCRKANDWPFNGKRVVLRPVYEDRRLRYWHREDSRTAATAAFNALQALGGGPMSMKELTLATGYRHDALRQAMTRERARFECVSLPGSTNSVWKLRVNAEQAA
jgi:hypothetical protein